MNVNHDLKVVWWLPSRTASRSVSEILAYYKFYNSILNLPVTESYTHAMAIPIGCDDYTLVCNIRNPYAKVLSTWHLRHFKQEPETGNLILEKSFSEFVTPANARVEESVITQNKRTPDFYVRVEHLIDDLHKLPFLDFTDPHTNMLINGLNTNNYTCEGGDVGCFALQRDPKNSEMTDYKSYYTQKELDIVWYTNEDVFNELGYSREFI
jgi:hypothetical protein